MNVPELHFCKAEKMTPKCFCKGKGGDFALSLSQAGLSELLGAAGISNSWAKKKKKKRKGRTESKQREDCLENTTDQGEQMPGERKT